MGFKKWFKKYEYELAPTIFFILFGLMYLYIYLDTYGYF